MRILAIIKYPPIEGGVSAQSYWLCHALATAGHSVRVITNAAEVEATYKIHMRPLDMQRLTRTMESGGSVEVRWTSPWARTRWHFTPENNPSVSRLATVALDNALQWCPDLIYAWYLEPYGVAASLVSLLTGLPVVVQHAGSDRYNLTRNEELGGLYRTLLRQANTVAKSGGNYAGLGIVGHQSRRLSSKYFLPSEFAPDGPTLDLGELLQEVADRGDRTENDLDTSPLDPDRAIVGCYGKVGRAKGTFELLEAYASSCRLRESSQLVMMSGGLFLPAVRKRIVQLGLEENVRLVPFLPHWRVPEFIRLCSVVAFLERDFPIVQHGPTVAGEVRACGRRLVVSEEIFAKQRKLLRGDPHVFRVPQPLVPDALAEVLRDAVEAAARGGRDVPVGGGRASVPLQEYGAEVARRLRLSLEPADGKRQVRAPDIEREVVSLLRLLSPELSKRASEQIVARIREDLADQGETSGWPSLLVGAVDDAVQELTARSMEGDRAVLLMEAALVWASTDSDPAGQVPFPTDTKYLTQEVAASLFGRGVTGDRLVPLATQWKRHIPWHEDLERYLRRRVLKNPIVKARAQQPGPPYAGRATEVVVVKEGHLSGQLYRLGQTSAAFLASCSGSRNLGQAIEASGISPASSGVVRGILERFCEAGLVRMMYPIAANGAR